MTTLLKQTKRLVMVAAATVMVGVTPISAVQSTTASAASLKLKYSKATVAMDADTGKIVYSKNMNQMRPIASVSKMMSLYLVRQKVDTAPNGWNTKVSVKGSGLKRMGNSSVYGGFKFKSGHKYTVKQLYEAAFVASSNNATIALGRWVSGSNAKFIKNMNNQAKKWKLGRAHFVSSSGLDNSDLSLFNYKLKGSSYYDTNKVSAKDVALIARHFIQDYPDALKVTAKPTSKADGQSLYNVNNLLKGRRYATSGLPVDGFKTGYTPLAGYCFVGTVQKEGRHRLITVVLHDEDEFTETRTLMNYAYKNFDLQ